MYELTLSPIYGILFLKYFEMLKNKRLEVPENILIAAEELKVDVALNDVNEGISLASRISQAEITNLIKSILQVKGDLSFGLDIGRKTHPSDFGTVGYSLMNCSNLHQVFDFAMQFKHENNEAFSQTLLKDGSHFSYQLSSSVDFEHLTPIIEFDFSAIIHLSRFFVGGEKAKQVKPCYVSFKHSLSGDINAYQDFFGCPVKFNQKHNEIVFHKSVFELPIHSANPKLFKLMTKKLHKYKQKLELEKSLKDKVYKFVFERVGCVTPALDVAAKEFNLGVSTFKKRLYDEGTNYTEVCDEVRKNIAIQLVLDKDRAIADVSLYLGFASTSTFDKAFKRWTNMTPLNYRLRKSN